MSVRVRRRENRGWKQEAPLGAKSERGNGDPFFNYLLEEPGSFPAGGSPLLLAWQQWAQAWLVSIGQQVCASGWLVPRKGDGKQNHCRSHVRSPL